MKMLRRLVVSILLPAAFPTALMSASATAGGGDGLTFEITEMSQGLGFHLSFGDLPVARPDKVVEAYSAVDKPGRAGWQSNERRGLSIALGDIRVERAKYGISLMRTAASSIDGFHFEDIASNDIYGAAIRIGKNAEGATTGVTKIQNVYADGKDEPHTSYAASNTDFIAIGPESAPVYLRQVTAKNFSDAIVDCKSIVYISNATFDNASRILRAHTGATIYISNSVINTGDGRALAWLEDSSSRIFYYNTLWNGQPDPDPNLIQSGAKHNSPAQAASQVVGLQTNPLLDVDGFFFPDSLQELTTQFSPDGAFWSDLATDGLMAGQRGLVGDVRFLTVRPVSSGIIRFGYAFEDGGRGSFIVPYQSQSR